ncbi:parapinopsin-like [Hoplias malabaricus]|uniref:parapinopsin-like n=1 Tax=Hoplias malabaricus TaxID=27720 RepID=UPI003463339B
MALVPELLNVSSLIRIDGGLDGRSDGVNDGASELSRAVLVALALVLFMFSVTAVVLNAAVMAVTLRHEQLKQPLNLALLSLAASDLGSTLTGALPVVFNTAGGQHLTGRVGCVTEGFCVAFFGISALCTVALIAVERVFVVCKPLGTILFQQKHAVAGVGVSWMWSLVWNTPPLFGWGRYELEGIGTSCGPDWQSPEPRNRSYIICYLLLCFAVPFLVIVVSYSWLLWTLRRMARLAGGAAAKAEARVAWMVVMMVVAFLLSWMPYTCLALAVIFKPDINISPWVKMVPIYTAKSSTVYNPIIYILMNKQFRRYIIPFLLCGKSPSPSEEASEEETTVSPLKNKIMSD